MSGHDCFLRVLTCCRRIRQVSTSRVQFVSRAYSRGGAAATAHNFEIQTALLHQHLPPQPSNHLEEEAQMVIIFATECSRRVMGALESIESEKKRWLISLDIQEILFKATKRGATIKKVIAYCAVQRVLLLLFENLSHTSFSVTRQFSIIYSNQKHSQLYLKVTGTVIKV